MADSEKDARLILRAEDRASKTFDAVAKSIASVRTELQQQAKAAAAGQGSLDDLTKSYKALDAAGNDLIKQQSAIKAFDTTTTAVERQEAAVKRAQKAYEDYQAKLNGKTPTDNQLATLEKKANAVASATDKLNTKLKSLDAAKTTLVDLGLSATQTSEQFNAIGDSFIEVRKLMLDAKTAIDGYDEGVRAAAASAAQLAEENRLLGQAAKLGIDTSQLDGTQAISAAIAIEEIRLNEVAIAEKKAAEASRIRRAEILETAKAIKEQEVADEALARTLEQLAAEESKAAGFRQIGIDAKTSEQYLHQFGATTTDVEASLTRLSDSVRKAFQPTAASVQTLDEALAQVDKSAALAADKQALRVSQYQDSLNALLQSGAALTKQAQQIEAYQQAAQALDKLEYEVGQAATRYDELRAAVISGANATKEGTAELDQAQRELVQLAQQARAAGTRLEQYGISLKRAGVDTDNLVAETDRIKASIGKATPAVEALTAKVGGGGKGFLGLKPFELQNLSYQINDVFTSLASGISPTQTLAQQGGQIVQIFPALISGAIKLLPVLLPLAAAFGLVAYNVSQANKEASAVRGFDAFFSLSGNAAGLSAKQFGDAQVALEKLGASADDAKAALMTFVHDGLNPDGLNSFISTAKTIADVTGISLPEAATKLGDAYTKGFDAIAQMNDILGGPLNEAQLQAIKNDFDAGDALDAHRKAQEAFTAAAQTAADKSKTDWQKQVIGLKGSFADLNEQLGLTKISVGIANGALYAITAVIQGVADQAHSAANAVKFLLNAVGLLPSASKTQTAGIAPGKVLTGAANPFGANAKTTNPRETSTSLAAYDKITNALQEQLDQTKKISAAERVRLAGVKAVNEAEAAGVSDPKKLANVRQLAASIEQGKVDKENAAAAKSAQSAADKAAREAETRQNKINSLTKELQDTFNKFQPENIVNPYAKLQADADNAVNDIRDKFAKLAKLGITTVNGKTEADFEAQVKSYEQQQEQQQKLIDGEKTLDALLEQRKTKLAAIEDAVASGTETPVQGLKDSQDVIDSTTAGIRAAGQAALVLAQNLNAAHPSPDLAKQIADIQAKLQSVSDVANNADLKAISDKVFKDSTNQLDALVAARDEFVKVQNSLNTAGLKSTTDTQNSIQKEYADTKQSILDQVDATQQLLDIRLSLGQITIQQYEQEQEKLNLVVAGTTKLSSETATLREATVNALAQGFSTFITAIGTNIANAISGAQNLGDTLKGIGKAALAFAASFTQAIAQAIVQLVALKIAEAALNRINFLGGGFHEGGVIGVDNPTFRRKVPAAAFAGAVRYHTGGIAGLRPDEVPAILQKGEEVVTRQDPRNRLNGGLTPGASSPSIKIVNTIDPGEFVSQGASTAPGQKAIINAIRANATAVKQALNG